MANRLAYGEVSPVSKQARRVAFWLRALASFISQGNLCTEAKGYS